MENFIHDELLKLAVQLLKPWKQSIPKFDGIDNKNKVTVSGNIKVLRRTIKDVDVHNGSFQKVIYLNDIGKDIENWKYLGWKKVGNYPKGHKHAAKRKHLDADYFTYYQSVIDGKNAYMNVKMNLNYKTEVLYCIKDTKEPGIRKGLPPDKNK